jgi:hypothetical protein
VPPHEKGIVKLSLSIDGVRVDDLSDRPSFFEFRAERKAEKKKRRGA